jgi:hypothetical protein
MHPVCVLCRFDQISIHMSLLPLTFLNFNSVSTSRKDAPTKATTFARATPAWRQQHTTC